MTALAISRPFARVKLRIWRLLAERALTRLVRRALQWMAPTGLTAEWAAQRDHTIKPQLLHGLDAAVIWAKWNAPKAASCKE